VAKHVVGVMNDETRLNGNGDAESGDEERSQAPCSRWRSVRVRGRDRGTGWDVGAWEEEAAVLHEHS